MKEAFNVAGTEYNASNFKRLGEDNDDYNMSKSEISEYYPDGARIYQYDISGVVTLVPEPDNEYDPNAIRVDVDGLKIGYIKRSETSKVREIISSGDYSVRINVAGYGKCKTVFMDTDLKTHVDTETDPSYFCQIIIDDHKEAPKAQPVVESAPAKQNKHGFLSAVALVLGIIIIILGVLLLLAAPVPGIIMIIIGVLEIRWSRRIRK